MTLLVDLLKDLCQIVDGFETVEKVGLTDEELVLKGGVLADLNQEIKYKVEYFNKMLNTFFAEPVPIFLS